MWSPRAEQVVRRLIAALPPNPAGTVGSHAARLSALPIGVSMWAEYYLRPNGEVVIFGEDYDRPDDVTVYSERVKVLRVLVWGSKRYPELRELLPEREPGASDCACVQHPEIFGPGKVICSDCGGVGWLGSWHAKDETMDESEVVDHLVSLPFEKFVMLMRRVFERKTPYTLEGGEVARFYLGTVLTSHIEGDDDVTVWQHAPKEACAYRIEDEMEPGTFGPAGDPCESGYCENCELPVVSNMKRAVCPICYSVVYLT